jgi:hypothetical protein
MQVSQLADVVALPLKRGPNLIADLESPLLALAPFSQRRNRRHRASLLHNEQITPGVQINIHMSTSQKTIELIFGEQSMGDRNATPGHCCRFPNYR